MGSGNVIGVNLLGGIRGVWWKARATIFSPWYEFSSLKLEAKYFLAYIVMNINSASRPENELPDQKRKLNTL